MRQDQYLVLDWKEGDNHHSARWRSENATTPPKRIRVIDDTMSADIAYRLACEGTALLWRGDFQNARQLLRALARRIDRKSTRPGSTMAETFHRYRQTQCQRARILGMVLIPFSGDYRIPLRRAPDVRQACLEVYGPGEEEFVMSLRELQGVIGAHEWRKNGIKIPALDGRIHPWYGVFPPIRSEYIDLVARAPSERKDIAFDIGTGTGVLAAVLARHGVRKVVATDIDGRSVACARDNLARLGLQSQVDVMQTDLFPEGQAPLIVCNPPWIPARPTSPIEHAIFDPDSRMLKNFLAGAADHLEPQGEVWLVLSDLAERLGLRSREELNAWINAGNLTVLARDDIRPDHPRIKDPDDPLHMARKTEVTSLWRLGLRSNKIVTSEE